MNHRAPVVVVYLAALVVLVLLTFLSQMRPESAISLDDGWEYRWEDGRDVSWRTIGFPSNPPDRDGATQLRLRRRLPASLPDSATLFIYSIDIGATLTVDGTEVYRWNVPAAGEDPLFRGWPWHTVSLPDGSDGAMLEIDVHSDYRDIGLWGRVYLGPPSAILEYLARRDLPYLAMVFLAIAVIIVMLGIAPTRENGRETVLLLATLTTLAVTTLADTHIRQLLWNEPFAWHIISFSGHAATVGFAALLMARIVTGPAARLSRWMGVLAFVGLAIGNLLFLSHLSGLAPLFLFNDAISVAALALFLTALATGGITPNEWLVLIVSFGVLAILVAVNVLVAWSVIPWVDSLSSLMLFQLIVAVLFIFLRRYRLIQLQLSEAATTIERRVNERTRELRRTNRRLSVEKEVLEQRAIRDPLTGLYNREYVIGELERRVACITSPSDQLAVGMFDLDHFKSVNDTFGHPVGDQVLRETADLLLQYTRESEIVGRYGGEEFIIVFDGCTVAQARDIASRLVAAIGEHSFTTSIRMTISGGVCPFTGGSVQQLIRLADEALYHAKHRGRNRLVAVRADGAAV